MAAVITLKQHTSSKVYLKQIKLTTYGIVLILCMLPPMFQLPPFKKANGALQTRYSPCCLFPCLHGGTCSESCFEYTCDCVGTNYYGRSCQKESFALKMLRYRQLFWSFCENVLLKGIIRGFNVINSMAYGVFVDVVLMDVKEPKYSLIHGGYGNQMFNICTEVLILPPVPEHCPTPLGVAGYQNLPKVDVVFNLLKRVCFVKSKTTVNLLFLAFAELLSQQMLGCSPVNFMGSQGLYGQIERIYIKGKVSRVESKYFKTAPQDATVIHRTVLLDILQSFVVREHNRVCEILHNEHADWDDQRLYDTAMHVVTGEIIEITSSEWLPIVNNYKRKIQKSHLSPIVANKVPYEAKLALFWPQMVPDFVTTGKSHFDLSAFWHGSFKIMSTESEYELIKILAQTAIGRMGHKNIPSLLEEQTKILILEGRKQHLQSFNNYRVFFGLQKYKSFKQLTDNSIVQNRLKTMYGDINGLELIPGLLLESPENGKPFGETTNKFIGDLILKAVITHPVYNSAFRNKFAFGGGIGWDIVKHANFESFICRNVDKPSKCFDEGLISFSGKLLRVDRGKRRTEKCLKEGLKEKIELNLKKDAEIITSDVDSRKNDVYNANTQHPTCSCSHQESNKQGCEEVQNQEKPPDQIKNSKADDKLSTSNEPEKQPQPAVRKKTCCTPRFWFRKIKK